MDADLLRELPRYDYVSPGLAIVRPDAAFPEMVVGDTQGSRWRWLRRWVKHNWYVDRRNPDAGFVSRDEAAILYNAARLVRGNPCLEIGCWRGWSAVHLALGSGVLDIVDPIFADPAYAEDIRQSCKTAGVSDAITFHAGFSPAAVDALGHASGKKWSLIFVDGDHEGDAPRLDAEAAMRHAADTAMVLFHDLASPYVAAGLDAMREAGWRTMVYQTMQIMGVAWRGNIEPPEHTPDPTVFWTLPTHLAGYYVSNWTAPTNRGDGGWRTGMSMDDNAAMMRARAVEDAAFQADAKVAEQREVVRLRAVLMEVSSKLTAWEGENTTLRYFVRYLTERRVILGLLRRSASERFKAIRTHAAGVQIDHLLPDELLHRLLRRRTLLGLVRRSKLACEAIITRAVAESLQRARNFEDLQESLQLVASGEANADKLRSFPGRLSPASLPTAAAGIRDSGLFDTRFYEKRPSIAGVVAQRANRLLHHLLPPATSQVNKERMDELRENVILVVHETSRTGAPILGWNIAQHLAARYNVFTVTLGGGPLAEDFRTLSAEMYGPFKHARRSPVDIEYGLRPLLDKRTFKYAIINSCESRSVIEACARRLIPTVMLMHEFGSYVYPRESLQAAFDMASEVVFPAQIVACSSVRVHPRLRERPMRILAQGICVLPGGTNAASPARPSPTIEALARTRNEGAFIVIGAGSVEYRKGVDLFLATAMAVRRDAAGSRVRFLWIGSGYRPREDMSYSVYLLEQLERSGLRDYVTFLDQVPDLDSIYALADAFLLSSRLDPLPNVSIDAAHRGIPVVCFKDASGMADLLLSDPETARGVVDYLDPIAAGSAILSLSNDQVYYTRAAAATRRLALSAFDMAKYVGAIDALGTAASARDVRKHEGLDLRCHADDFDLPGTG